MYFLFTGSSTLSPCLMLVARTGRPRTKWSTFCSKVAHQFKLVNFIYLFVADRSTIYYITAEDIADLTLLRSKLQMPSSPPDPAQISPNILALHNTIASRYVGAASLINLKTPQEVFQKHQSLLRDVREGNKTLHPSFIKAQLEKAYRLSTEQQAVYHSGVGSYVNFGGHGSGGETLYELIVMTFAQASPS